MKRPTKALLLLTSSFIFSCGVLDECTGMDPKQCRQLAEQKVTSHTKSELSSKRTEKKILWPKNETLKTFGKIYYAACSDRPEAWINEGLISNNKILWIKFNQEQGRRTKIWLSKKDFIKNYSQIVTPKIKKAILNQNPSDIFQNDQGCMIGSGELWFQSNGTITTFNDMEAS